MAAPNLTISPTPPPAPTVGDLWWNNTSGFLYIWYDDGSSLQWVSANPALGPKGEKGDTGDASFIGAFHVTPISAGQIEMDISENQAFGVAVTGPITLQTILNADPAQISTFLVMFTDNGTQYTHSWPGWTWLTGIPILSYAPGKRDLIVVFSVDGVNFFATMYAQYF